MILVTAALLLAPPVQLENPGQMYIVGKARNTIMPLERTSVTADVAGMGARVSVRQTFVNPSSTPIEAVYTFPLPHDAAVDQMKIKIGDRTIDGTIMRRAQAKAVYDRAKANGQTAALLDQETDNVFTQSVANIMPGRRITVEISYVQLVKFDEGEFEFTYPMVVGPRFLGAGTKNPEKLSPPTLPPGVRSGATIDLTLNLHGSPIQDFHSVLHQVRTSRVDADTVQVALAKRDEIPNRDFIFRYRTASKDVQESTFTTWDEKTGGHFALVLAPPPRLDASLRTPKEMIFVIDQSGSQQGFPIDKSKELSLALLATMTPQDTFNVMGFSNEVNPLWPGPVPNTPENRKEAIEFIKGLQADGGTELEKAVVAALSPSSDPERVRIVLFNTDGFAGQESVILKNVQQFRRNSRLYTFGIGNSVNRGLIDAMSEEGRGASEVVTLAEGAEAAKNRFAKRLETPLLVNVEAKFEGTQVTGVTPGHLPDVFSTKPVVVYGRYSQPGKTRLTLTGISGGRPWRRVVDVDLPKGKGDGSSVSSLWARTRIAEMKSQGYTAKAMGQKAENEEAITKLALDYRIMSEYTSFVAVDSSVPNPGKQVQTARVPVDMADGVSLGLPASSPSIVAMQNSSAASAPGGAGGGGNLSYFKSGKSASGGVGRSRGGADFAQLNDSTMGFITYDPANNSLVPGEGKAKGKRTVEIAKGLLETKVPVALRISVFAISQTRLELLRKAGLKIGSHDGATLVFGTASAATIRAIAKLEFVERISWLHSPEN